MRCHHSDKRCEHDSPHILPKKNPNIQMDSTCSSLVLLAYGSDDCGEDDNKLSSIPSSSSSSSSSWNSRFQSALSAQNGDEMASLAAQFASAACALARCVVEEMFVAPNMRTLQPSAVGGVAGGPKFVRDDILLKLSCDWKGGQASGVFFWF